jgi:Protein of unknown function (DUF2997)
MAKRIEVTIDENGETTIEVHGAVGQECEALTADLEAALGKTTDRKRKREYYQRQQTQQQQATN